MNVLKEILDWSTSRPAWQRDALRRLVTQGPLSLPDLEELTLICKARHGLAGKHPALPLESKHIPADDPGRSVVSLRSLTHHTGVNALALDQRLEFGPGLTIVYGDNASGKSGYTRVLKRACRARGAEEILGNVLSGAASARPSATIQFKVGDQERSVAWQDERETDKALGNVSVFDSHCAAVYLSEKTDVAFRPFGLDLFDQLSAACEAMRRTLDKEASQISTPLVDPSRFAEGTTAYELVSHITSLTKPEEVRKLATVSEVESERLKDIGKQLKDLRSDDPKKTSQTLTLRAQRLESLRSHLARLTTTLSDVTIQSAFDARSNRDAARAQAKKLQESTFPVGLLQGTGSDVWRSLWEAARRFSGEEAYPDKDYPFTDHDAQCVLCQQTLPADVGKRLHRFEEFVRSTIQQDLQKAEATFVEAREALEKLVVADESIHQAVEELRMEDEELAKSIETNLQQVSDRRTRSVSALTNGDPLPDLPPCVLDYAAVEKHATSLQNRATQVAQSNNNRLVDSLSKEALELEARVSLSKELDSVLNEIERLKKVAAYGLCRGDTDTHSVTRKSTEITTQVVTDRLAASFQAELGKLRFLHLEVELRAAGGARGALYHELVLRRNPGAPLTRVVSEGEARTLSIAAFFAELSTASDQSAILFDDPVSSLDHNWREGVAGRLAEEAKIRQVVVFTHDVVFLLALVGCAERSGAQCDHQYLHRERQGAGVSSPDLPWIAMNVRERIGVLKNQWQGAEKLNRTATRPEYEREAVLIYGALRETWERALEEVLLNGTVVRYRRNIQTQQIGKLSDITDGDCQGFEAGFMKCSRWLPGHDQAPAENVPVPEANELKRDIETLEEWVGAIRQRRR